MLKKDILYKGLTRPPMLFGIPLVPLFIMVASILFITLWINLFLVLLIIPCYMFLKVITKLDEKIFQVIWAKRTLLLSKIKNQEYKTKFNANIYSSINYKSDKIKGINNKDQLTMLKADNSIPINELIPYSSQVSDSVVKTKDDFLTSTWIVEGISFETRSDDKLDSYKNSLNTLLISLSQENLAFYFHNIKDYTYYDLEPEFVNPFAKEINEKYVNSFKKNEFMENRLFVTVVFRKTTSERINTKMASKEEKRDNFSKRLEQFNELCGRIETILDKFSVYKLSCYTIDDVLYSQQLEFFNYLLTLKYQRIRVLNIPIDTYLGSNEFSHCANAVMKITNPTGQLFVKSIEIKDWVEYTKAGFLDELINFSGRYIVTQSFCVLPKMTGRSAIDKQLKKLKASEDDAIEQVKDLQDAKEDLISGKIIMGEHHFSILLYADSEKELNQSVNRLIGIINDLGLIVSINWLATDEAYFAQLPSNFKFRPKTSMISSLNFIGFNSLHNNPIGKKTGNCWGNSVALLKTTANQPFYFNFHQTRIGRDDLDEKRLAHSLMIGKSGTGKTMLMSFFLNQLTQYESLNSFHPNTEIKKFTAVYFDKDYGAEINIRALGGKYFSLKNGEPTGFNPFMCESTAQNIEKIIQLIEILATPNNESLSVKEKNQINNAVNAVMREKLQYRTYGISLLLENIQEDFQDDNSLRKRLLIWKRGNAYGWVFDNEFDLLDFNEYSIYGFDGTEILDNKNIITPISFYILYRIEQIADGRRLAIFMDEFWKWLQGEAFQRFVYDGLKTLRKRNAFLFGATQSPDEILKSEIARAIIEQVETFIFLPNGKAKEEEYTKGFQISTKEYEIIKNLSDDSRQFLVKKGNEEDGGDSRGNTVLAKLDLSGLDKENLKILSATIDNVEILHEIIEEVGNDPNVWLPIFKDKCI